MPVTEDEFKRALRSWASGVTVVTTKSEAGDLQGMTVSAFSSVSADPPLVLVCVNQGASSSQGILQSERFAVNVLRDDQSATSGLFASSKSPEDRFAEAPWREGLDGVPLLEGCIGTLECTLVQKVEAGSHWVLIGEVQATHAAEGAPLLYFDGGYRSLASS